MKHAAYGLTALFFLQSFIPGADASPQIFDDSIEVIATRPFVTLGGMPQELYDLGDTLTITTNLTTNDPLEDLEAVVIMEVRDSSDITTLLEPKAITIPSGSELNISLPWTPEKRDAYLVRTYVISDLINPQLFTEPMYWKTVVVEAGAGHIIDSVAIGNQTNGLPRMISKTNISNSPIGSGYSYMYVEGDTVCIVWLEKPPGIDYSPPGTPPMYRISLDGGQSFSQTRELAGSNDMESCDSSNTYDYDNERHIRLNETYGLQYDITGGNGKPVSLMASVHDDFGIGQTRWSNQLAYSEMVRDVLIRSEGENVYVMWSDIPYGHGERQLFFASSNDLGEHVHTTKLRSSLNGNSIYPTHMHLMATNNTIILLWSDTLGVSTMTESDYDWRIFTMRSTDGGKTLSGLVDLIPDAYEAHAPQLIYDNGVLYLIWQEYDANYQSDIFFAKSTDFGLTFIKG
jgi:hypothetical protein